MKRTIKLFSIVLGLLLCGSSFQQSWAQDIKANSPVISYQNADVCPGLTPGKPILGAKATWDLDFSYNITDTTTWVGCAGIAYVGGNIWVSKWQSDSIMQLNPNGQLINKFVIAGLTGVRSLTYDGTYLYAGTNSTTVYRINPTTKTLAPPHITVAAAARWITYDATLNSGAGGFWYGNFATDITAVNMTGTVLSSIPAATHGLTGMYGAAIDNVSFGGPYLWIFNQGGANNCQIQAVSLPAGTLSVYTHDAFLDVNTTMALTSSLAGGLFLSPTIIPGKLTLLGILQGTPNNVVLGYDIAISSGITDVAVNTLKPVQGYTQIPVKQAFPEVFNVNISNNGTTLLNSVSATVTVRRNGTSVHSEVLSTTNLASAASITLSTAAYTPTAIGDYTVDVVTALGVGQTDEDATNDTLGFHFAVTDSVFARDNNIPDGGPGYAVSGTDWAYALTKYTLVAPDTLNGIWIQLATPIEGDTTYAILARTTGGIPDSLLAAGPLQIIDSAQHMYFLDFTNPIIMTPGTYSFGCYEGVPSTINLAQSTGLYTIGMNHFYTPTSGWTTSGITTARFIRPYFKKSGTPSSVAENGFDSGIRVFPNPSNGMFYINLPASLNSTAVVNVYEPCGRIVSSLNIKATGSDQQLDLNNLPRGLYFMQISCGGFNETQKIIINK